MRRRTLYRNGHVYVPTRGFPTAMLVDDTRVLWVGGEADADGQVDEADRVVDLHGCLVTTPFVDPIHFVAESAEWRSLTQLKGARSRTEALDRLAAAARTSQGPVTGFGYDEGRWPEQRPPTPEELARAVEGRPAVILRADKGACVCSPAFTAGAVQVGVDTRGLADMTRRPGLGALLTAIVAQRTPAQQQAILDGALSAAAAHGIGCLHDHISSPRLLDGFTTTRPQLPGPVVQRYLRHVCRPDEDPAVLLREHDLHGFMLQVDGPVNSHQAALHETYIDLPGQVGPDPMPAETIAEHLVAASLAGIRTSLVAMGDRAADAMIDGMRTAVRTVGLDRFRSLRHRTMTLALADPRVLGTLIDLGVVVVRVPQVDSRWGGPEGDFTRALGTVRAREMMRFGSLGVDGLLSALASTSPWLDLDPWQTLRSARWHRFEEERVSVGEAFHAHTVGGWHASGHDTRGYLGVGLPADFVVWEVPPGELGEGPHSQLETPGLPRLRPEAPTPRALLTVVGGRAIHESEGALP